MVQTNVSPALTNGRIPHVIQCTLQEQYFFIYRTVLHALLYGDTEVGVANLSDHLSFLQQSAEGNEEETHLDREFKVTCCAI